MRAVVLGAGASFGRADPGAVKPPLVDDFFRAALNIGIFEADRLPDWQADLVQDVGVSWEELVRRVPQLEDVNDPAAGHLSVLQAFVDEQLGISTDSYDRLPIDIERLMGLIEGELLGYHGMLRLSGDTPQLMSSPADVLQQQLYLVLCGTLIETTQGTCPYHYSLVKWLDPTDAIISFNYDLLVDRALKQRGDWTMNDGYRLSFHRIGHHAGESGDWREPLETRSSIPLLKLHGSLNWLYPRNATQVALNIDLHGANPKAAPSLLYCLEELHTDFWTDHPLYEWWERYDHKEDDMVFDLHTLIVPPSVTKPYRNLEPLIGDLWARAARILVSEATEILFIGYSLRPEDVRSSWLFRKAARENSQLKRVSVVDPSDDVLTRIDQVFDRTEVNRAARSLEEFVGDL